MLDALIELIPILRNSLLNDREKRLVALVIFVSLPLTMFLVSFTVAYNYMEYKIKKEAEIALVEEEEEEIVVKPPVHRIIKYDKMEKDALYLLLSKTVSENNFEYAGKIAEKIMLSDSTDSYAQYVTAKIYVENHKYPEANEILLTLKEKKYMPDSVKTLLISTVSFDELQKIIADTNSLTATQLAKAGERITMANSNSNSSAYTFFAKALQKDSSNAEALYQSARWNMGKKNYGTAEKLLKKLLLIDSTSARFQGRYAILLHETGRSKSALSYYKRAVEINPYDFNLAFNLGELYYSSLNDRENARKYFLKAIELSPEVWQSYFKLGMISVEENNYEEAINYFIAADSYSANNSRILHMLAPAYERNGDNDNALRIYGKLLKINPLDDIALYKKRLLKQD